MTPHICIDSWTKSAQGWIQGGAKIGPGGSLLQRTSSSDRKATATYWMHSSDLEAFGKKYCYIGFIGKSNFWRVLDFFLDCPGVDMQGGAKIGQWGIHSPKDCFFSLEGYSDKANAYQWSKSMWEEGLVFLVPCWSQFFLCVFDIFFDLVILVYFNAISIDFCAIKSLSALILCNFHLYKWKNA